MMGIISINKISKNYGETKALDDLSITIEQNKIYGLLGRNGSGKTTLLDLITNRIFPTSGEITIDGEPVYENDNTLSQIYYMTEENLYPESEKVKNVYKWTAEFYSKFDIEYAKKLSVKFGLDINKKVKALSTGYSSIFKAILTLASNADILLFDEPVLGLDAFHRELFYKELILKYNESPKTIILSTHLIEEVAHVIEIAIIIKNGKLILKESVENLLENTYFISGEISKVDEYIKNKNTTGNEKIGMIKSAIVLEKLHENDKVIASELKLDVTKVELQKLFISLTNN